MDWAFVGAVALGVFVGITWAILGTIGAVYVIERIQKQRRRPAQDRERREQAREVQRLQRELAMAQGHIQRIEAHNQDLRRQLLASTQLTKETEGPQELSTVRTRYQRIIDEA